ncbi:MAG: hypothetical protein EOO62_13530, partial [Hymenobacter sp.]
MMKFLHLRWLLVVLLGLGSLSAAQASHILGGDITYKPIASTTAGVPRYHVVARRFVYIYADGTILLPIKASRGGCSAQLAGSFTVQVPITRFVDVTSGCSGPSLIPYRMVYHEVDMDLPPGEWLLSYADNNRAAAVMNITNSDLQTFYVETYLDNTVWAQDSSPQIESIVQPYANPAALSPYSLSAFDADGDSLRYEFIVPQGGCNQPLASSFTPH